MRFSQGFIASVFTFALAGCLGGGGGDDNNTNEQETNTEEESSGSGVQMNQGGTPSNPAAIDYVGLNEIGVDEFDNHYRVVASAGDILVIESQLEKRIDRQRVSRCGASGTYWTGVRFLDDSARACSRYFYHKFEKTSEKILKFGFPDDNNGYFAATLIRSGSGKTISQVIGEGGTPDSLGGIGLDGRNRIESFDHLNHYGYEGKEGETIYLQAYTSPAEDSTTGARCSASSGGFSMASSFGWTVFREIGEYVDEPGYNCSDYLEYTLPEDGIYHFSFRSTRGTTGYFRATATPSPL